MGDLSQAQRTAALQAIKALGSSVDDLADNLLLDEEGGHGSGVERAVCGIADTLGLLLQQFPASAPDVSGERLAEACRAFTREA